MRSPRKADPVVDSRAIKVVPAAVKVDREAKVVVKAVPVVVSKAARLRAAFS